MDEAERAAQEIESDFEWTQPIGDAIHALAEAELAVAAVDEVPTEDRVRLERVLYRVISSRNC